MQGKFSFPPHLRKLLTVFTITIVAVTIAATLYDFYTPPNALYLQTRLQQEGLLILSLYLIILTLINQADAWWKKYWRWVALLLPLVCWGAVLLLRLFPFDRFFHLSKEDRFFEISQVVVLLAGSGLSAWFGRDFWKKEKRKLAGLFFIFALGFFFVAGEEISWGQRIAEIEPSAKIQEINYQGEYTLHNLNVVHHQVFEVYLVLSFLALVLPLLTLVKPLRRFHDIVPSIYLTGFFLAAFSVYYGQWQGKISLPWQEPAEVFFYAGCVAWITQLWLLVRTSK